MAAECAREALLQRVIDNKEDAGTFWYICVSDIVIGGLCLLTM